MEIEITDKEAGVIIKLLKESLNPMETIEPVVVIDNDVECIIKNVEGAVRAEAIWDLLLYE